MGKTKKSAAGVPPVEVRAQLAVHPAVAAARARQDAERAALAPPDDLWKEPPPRLYYLCRMRSGRREYGANAGGNWVPTQDQATALPSEAFTPGRGEFLLSVDDAARPDVESDAVLRADAAALSALRDWEAAVAEVGRRFPTTPGSEGLERRCRERLERALVAADREAR